MTPEVQCGVCMMCGAPMYVPKLWWGVTPPTPRRTCSCHPVKWTPVKYAKFGGYEGTFKKLLKDNELWRT